jgi:sulfate/thiosulfate transport system substrate-binding protein
MLRTLYVLLAVGLAATVAAGCGGTDDENRLTLVAYSTPKEAYEDLIPAFTETPEGADLDFDQSYGSSGEQARAVEGGLEADVVALSLEPDVTKLADAGLVDEGWNQDRHKGMVTRSVVVFAVREGNPKDIRTWDDLVRDDVEVVTPNPFTSGGAQWNVMAAYGAQLEQGKSPDEALDYLRQMFENVEVQDKSARESLATFTGGKGDVLLAYENEAVTAQDKGEELEYVVPRETILIENPVAVVNETNKPDEARAFVDFLRTEPAQRIFAEKGYRPVLDELRDKEHYPDPAGLFTIAELGGWADVRTEFFDPENGSVTQILEDLGVSTEAG